jgi:hypothetical protein
MKTIRTVPFGFKSASNMLVICAIGFDLRK